MKQILLLMAAMLLCCCSSDCEVKAEVPANAGKTLVVYYSYTGNCREIVNSLRSQITADVLEIQPAEKGQRYEANNYALGTQLLNAIKANPNSASSYPAIDPVTTSLTDYQNIIIVTPLWWSQMAAIMQTYLFNYGPQMAGKHVGLIVSSASSGISQVVADAKRLVPDATWMGDALWINNSNRSNAASLIENWLKKMNFAENSNTMDKMYITIGGQTQSITLVDNAATRALVQKLPVTVTLNSSGGFEIWGVVLYNGSNICLFYDSNSWSYTRLGKIDGLSESQLRTFLKAGESNISVRLSQTSAATAIRSLTSTKDKGDIYSLNGQRMTNPSAGVYIKNGKKVIL